MWPSLFRESAIYGMSVERIAGAGASLCAMASFIAAAAGGTVAAALPLAIAGGVCAMHAPGVARGTFRSQCYVLAAEIAAAALSWPVAPVAVAAVVALLFSRTGGGVLTGAQVS